MEILHDLKMQFVDLLLVMWIFWGQIGHKNYEDFEHPTRRVCQQSGVFMVYVNLQLLIISANSTSLITSKL